MTTANDRTERQRRLRSLLTDSAYATIGAGGAAVELMRSIDRRSMERIRTDAPRQAREPPDSGALAGPIAGEPGR